MYHWLLIWPQHPFCPAEMYRQKFWMCHFGSKTMKRTVLWSTSSALAAFQIYETMKRADFKFNSDEKTAEKYQSKSGLVGYKGAKLLKETQILDCD